jgi:hypothetical protein
MSKPLARGTSLAPSDLTAPFSYRVLFLVIALIQRIDLDARLIPAETVSKQ